MLSTHAGDRAHDGAPSLRLAQADELAALAALIEGHALFARYRLTPATLRDALQVGLHAGDAILGAWQGAQPLGFAWWQARGAFARSPYLRLLVVAPGATGSGVGAHLLEAITSDAFAEANDLFLLVTHDNLAAQRFYTRNGFERVGVLHDYVIRGIDEVLMRKRKP